MSIKPLFTATATATGGRNGHTEASDHSVAADLSVPKQMGGPGKAGTTTPEHLFAAGYAACFQGALANRAKTKGVDTSDSKVTAHVSFGPSEDGGFGLAVELEVSIPGVEPEQAQELLELAHQFCPYSKATRGNIVVTLTAV